MLCCMDDIVFIKLAIDECCSEYPIVTFIFSISLGMEYNTGSKRFSSGRTIAVLSPALGFDILSSFIRFDRSWFTILACPTPDGTPTSVTFLLSDSERSFDISSFEGNLLRLSLIQNDALLRRSFTSGES